MQKLVWMVVLVLVTTACDLKPTPPDEETHSDDGWAAPGWGVLPEIRQPPDCRPRAWTECRNGFQAEWRDRVSNATRVRTNAHVRYRVGDLVHGCDVTYGSDVVHIWVKGGEADDLEYFTEEGDPVLLKHRRREAILRSVSSLQCDGASPPQQWWMSCGSLEVATRGQEWRPPATPSDAMIYFRTLGGDRIEWYTKESLPWTETRKFPMTVHTTGMIANVARIRCE